MPADGAIEGVVFLLPSPVAAYKVRAVKGQVENRVFIIAPGAVNFNAVQVAVFVPFLEFLRTEVLDVLGQVPQEKVTVVGVFLPQAVDSGQGGAALRLAGVVMGLPVKSKRLRKIKLRLPQFSCFKVFQSCFMFFTARQFISHPFSLSILGPVGGIPHESTPSIFPARKSRLGAQPRSSRLRRDTMPARPPQRLS